MSEQLPKHGLAVTGTVLYIVHAAPATIQIARRKGIDPEAALTLGLLVLTGLWWFAYSLEIHNWPSLLSAVLGLIAPAYGLIVLGRMRRGWSRRALVAFNGLVWLVYGVLVGHPLLGAAASSSSRAR